MLRGDMLRAREKSVTSEYISRGPIPSWLLDHLIRQSTDSTPFVSGGPSRIMVIYPNENSRRQVISRFNENLAIESNLHHTINSLVRTLIADFRLPRIISNRGPLELIIHEECRLESKKLGFPLINPIPSMDWGRGKTRSLTDLFATLSKENSISNWDGPGAGTFPKLIARVEKKLGGTHPDMGVLRVIEALRARSEPFSFLDIDGIIMLNQQPSFPQSHLDLMLEISHILPIHQLVYPGNFRLGTHGKLLLDEFPITNPRELPNWVPSHKIDSETPVNKVSRTLIQREAHSIDASIDIAQSRLQDSKDDVILIVDPSLEENRHRWHRAFRNIGIQLNPKEITSTMHPLGNWLKLLISLPHGADAFSFENMKSIASQSVVKTFETPASHPTDPSIEPVFDLDVLSRIARDNHILGGPGTLLKWLQSLSRVYTEENEQSARESAQWWVLCLANSLTPLLCDADKKALLESEIRIGCHSGAKLPLVDVRSTGDEWLFHILGSLETESLMELSQGNSPSIASVQQTILDNHTSLREMQSVMSHTPPLNGIDWVDEMRSVLDSAKITSIGNNPKQRILLHTPSDSMGCNSDLTILTHLSSNSWPLKVKRVAFLGEQERHRMNILRPDGPIRDARHHLLNLIYSASETIILDSQEDDSSPPAAPLREYTSDAENEIETNFLEKKSIRPVSPKDFRQRDGQEIFNGRNPYRTPIKPSSISISFDSLMHQELSRRQPFRASPVDGYLDEELLPNLVSIERKDLLKLRVPKRKGIGATSEEFPILPEFEHEEFPTLPEFEHPRYNERWPVVGGLYNRSKTPTIDPRPLKGRRIGEIGFDSRNGHGTGVEQSVSVWSPSRLQDWIRCPRMGWLTRGIGASEDDIITEDLDNRTQGTLLHNVHYDIISKVLGLEIGKEKVIDYDSPMTISESYISDSDMMEIALSSLDFRAPWLERTDAVSNQRLRSFTGMGRNEWNSWLADPAPVPTSGRVGALVRSERSIGDSAPICLEWSIGDNNQGGVEISIPDRFQNGDNTPPFKAHGFIDRVDLLPFDKDSEKWYDPRGNDSVAPLMIHGSNWKPKRIVAIRDLKSSDTKKPQERHDIALLEEIQLAIYARSWELSHPGDLVVAAGISVIGHNTEHFLEKSKNYTQNSQIKIGKITNLSSKMYRFPNEDAAPKSDPFRAWLSQRLLTASRAAKMAYSGHVVPTPSESSCRFCKVRNACDARVEVNRI